MVLENLYLVVVVKLLPPFHLKTSDGHFIVVVPLDAKHEKIPQYYGFSKDRHTGSFFLKIGAALFCLGSLVHNGLYITEKVSECYASMNRFLSKSATILH